MYDRKKIRTAQNVTDVSFFVVWVNEYIIDEDDHELIKKVHEYFIHHMHEEGGGVGEAKRHDGILIETVASGESGLGNIPLSNF